LWSNNTGINGLWTILINFNTSALFFLQKAHSVFLLHVVQRILFIFDYKRGTQLYDADANLQHLRSLIWHNK
jgi:hypothetical protein